MKDGISKKEMGWIDEVVDKHKMFRSEASQTRVKLLMLAAMVQVIKTPVDNSK